MSVGNIKANLTFDLIWSLSENRLRAWQAPDEASL